MARNPEMGGGRAKSGSLERGVQGVRPSRPRREPPGSVGNDGEPTESRGLLESVEDSLNKTHLAVQDAFSGPPSVTRPQPTERSGRRPPNDERPGLLGQGVRPPSNDEEVIVPGDPSNLGARGRRRRTVDQVNNPPLLRRGLLGV